MADSSIEQILSPLIIRAAHQTHDVAAGVEIERARLACQLHAGFSRKLIAFAAIAGMAASDQVFPGRGASAGAGDYVVERQFARGQNFSAILAGAAIAQQDVLARQRTRLMRDAAVFK